MPQTSTTSKTSSSQSTTPAAPSPSTLSLSRIAPDKVRDLSLMLNNQQLWDRLESLLLMVRQDHLESLADPDVDLDQMRDHRAVAQFIRHFIENVRPALQSQNESIKREQAGLPPENHTEGDPYMDLSPDLDDPEGLDTRPEGALN